jgi:hypothetical protein
LSGLEVGSEDSVALCSALRTRPGHLTVFDDDNFSLCDHDLELPHTLRAYGTTNRTVLEYYRSQLPVLRGDLVPLTAVATSSEALLRDCNSTAASSQRSLTALASHVTALRREVGDVRQDVLDVRREVSTLRTEVHALGASVTKDIAAVLAAVSHLVAASSASTRPVAGVAGTVAGAAVDASDVVVGMEETHSVVDDLRTKSSKLRDAALPVVPGLQGSASVSVL